MARYIPVAIVGLVALGLWIGDVDPAWWITGLVAAGLAIVITANATVAGRSLRLAPYIPALLIGLVALGLLIAGAVPWWWITALIAIGIGLVVFMGKR